MKAIRCKSKGGSALVVVMCFTTIILLIGVTMYRMSTNLAYRVGCWRRGGQALSLAEAGVEDALQKLSGDYAAYSSNNITGGFGDGTYSVSITPNGDTGAIISSTGMYQNTIRVTVLETLGNWESEWSTNIFSDYGILCDGFVDVNGSGILHADLYSGDSVDIAPGCTVEGTVDSVGTVDNKGTVEGTTNEYVAPIPFPTFEFSDYVAEAGGDYISGDVRFDQGGADDYTYTPSGLISGIAGHGNTDGLVTHPSLVICVDGDVVIGNKVEIQGSIIATGSIDMQGGHISQSAGNGMPSLMALGGSCEVRSGQNLDGFVYATGDVVLNGGDTINGGVLCGGQFYGRSDWQIYPGDGVVPPGVNPGSKGRVTGVRIGAWLR